MIKSTLNNVGQVGGELRKINTLSLEYIEFIVLYINLQRLARAEIVDRTIICERASLLSPLLV